MTVADYKPAKQQAGQGGEVVAINYDWYCIPGGMLAEMERLERFYKIDQLLRARRTVSRDDFLSELEISPATFKRDLEYLRDRFMAPIEYDRELNGYHYAEGSNFVLPGLWMNAEEIHALLTMQHLLADLQPGLLGPHIEPLIERISKLLESGDHTAAEVQKRIKVLNMGSRPVDDVYFEVIASALLARQRLSITHYNRGTDQSTDREVSPQRLVHYRDNWYLDAWCHLRNGLRCFSVEAITWASPLEKKAKDIDEVVLDRELGTGYGIFTGCDVQRCQLRFTPERARWVANEQWHPEQKGWFDEEGYYCLEFPFSDPRELIMDILRNGADVEVLGPPRLRQDVASCLEASLQQYNETR